MQKTNEKSAQLIYLFDYTYNYKLSLPELVVYFNDFTFLPLAAIQDGNGAFWDLKSSSKADFPVSSSPINSLPVLKGIAEG